MCGQMVCASSIATFYLTHLCIHLMYNVIFFSIWLFTQLLAFVCNSLVVLVNIKQIVNHNGLGILFNK